MIAWMIYADVLFNEEALKKLSFPISKSIRMSFWIEGQNLPSFSEFTPQSEIVNLNKFYEAKVTLPHRPFFENVIEVGVKFFFGSHPVPIGFGIIRRVEER
jgi:hypothetical protein